MMPDIRLLLPILLAHVYSVIKGNHGVTQLHNARTPLVPEGRPANRILSVELAMSLVIPCTTNNSTTFTWFRTKPGEGQAKEEICSSSGLCETGYRIDFSSPFDLKVNVLPVISASYECVISGEGKNDSYIAHIQVTDAGFFSDQSLEVEEGTSIVLEYNYLLYGPIFDQKSQLRMIHMNGNNVTASASILDRCETCSVNGPVDHHKITIPLLPNGHNVLERKLTINGFPGSMESLTQQFTNIFVHGPIIDANLRPENSVFQIGSYNSTTLTCRLKEPSPDIYTGVWEHDPGNGSILVACTADHYIGNRSFSCSREYELHTTTLMDLTLKDVNFDHAGRYSCRMFIEWRLKPVYLDRYSAQVIVTDKTSCNGSESEVYVGQIMNLFCSVTYKGKASSNLILRDGHGSILENKTFIRRLSYNSTAGSLGELLYKCTTIFPGFIYHDHGCGIKITSKNPVKNMHLRGGLDLMEGREAVLNCIVELALVVSGGKFRWSLNGKAISDGRRFEVKSREADNVNQTSTLLISSIKVNDTGRLECMFTIGEIANLSSTAANISVLGYPEVKPSNNSLTLEEGKSFTLLCEGKVVDTGHPDVDKNFNFTWYRNESKIVPGEGIDIKRLNAFQSELNVSNKQVYDTSYSCDAENEAGISDRKKCDVFIIKEGIKTCDKDEKDGILWPEIPVRKIVKNTCPHGSTGMISRKCLVGGEWEEPNDEMCVDKVYVDILEEINDIEDGLEVNTEQTASIAKSLDVATGSNNDTSEDPKPITPGNLNASIEAIVKLANVHHRLMEPPSVEEVQAIVEICSKLIDLSNHGSWRPLLQREETLSTEIMSTLDSYATSVFKLISGVIADRRKEHFTKNIFLSTDKWTPQNGSLRFPKNERGDWTEETDDYISVSNGTLLEIMHDLGTDFIPISNTYYRTLTGITPNGAKNTDKTDRGQRNESSNVESKILSIGVINWTSSSSLSSPVKLHFQTPQNYPHTELEETCIFWNFSLGDSGNWSSDGCRLSFRTDISSVCICDHMTNFALLVSRYTPEGTPSKVLSVLSIVGSSLSIGSMIATMAIYVSLRSTMNNVYRGNRSRGIMVMNLCLVLTMANLLFMTGVEQVKIKGLCVAIAAILHYLFLVAFGTMLATSIQLYLKVSSLARGMKADSKRQTLAFVIGAWSVPAVIVGISLGSSNITNYTNKNFCWLSLEKEMILSFIVPVVFVIIVNSVIMYVVISKNVKSKTSGLSGSGKTFGKAEIARSTAWSVAVLTPIMGTTWIFGMFAVNKDTVAFQFIFVLLNSTQGIFIFIFHCLMDASVRKALTIYCKAKKSKKLAKKEMKEDKDVIASIDTSPESSSADLLPNISRRRPGGQIRHEGRSTHQVVEAQKLKRQGFKGQEFKGQKFKCRQIKGEDVLSQELKGRGFKGQERRGKVQGPKFEVRGKMIVVRGPKFRVRPSIRKESLNSDVTMETDVRSSLYSRGQRFSRSEYSA